MTIESITYIPSKDTIQSSISFEYSGRTEYTVVIIDRTKDNVITDYTTIKDDPIFQQKCTEAINTKIDQIENPIKLA